MRGTATAWTTIVALVAGCAVHWDVETYAVPGGDVGSKQTWAWKGGEFVGSARIEPGTVSVAEAAVRAAVREELSRKGYRELGPDDGPDLLVSYRVSGMQRFVLEETPRIGAPSPNTVLSPSEVQPPPASSVPREVAVREGSVILFLDDPRAGKLAWRGEVAEQVRAGSAEQAGRIIGQMAREIAREVPVRALR